jgi:hypothetical protein
MLVPRNGFNLEILQTSLEWLKRCAYSVFHFLFSLGMYLLSHKQFRIWGSCLWYLWWHGLKLRLLVMCFPSIQLSSNFCTSLGEAADDSAVLGTILKVMPRYILSLCLSLSNMIPLCHSHLIL